MSVLRKYRKTIEKTNLYFDPEMYNNIVGSLVLSHYVLSLLKGEAVDKENIKKVWKKLKKGNSLDFWLDDKDFIPKVLSMFDMKPYYNEFCYIQSEYNVLFLPYVDCQVIPIREDGIFPFTARTGKIYLVKEEAKDEIE